jgi:hypothetical protein
MKQKVKKGKRGKRGKKVTWGQVPPRLVTVLVRVRYVPPIVLSLMELKKEPYRNLSRAGGRKEIQEAEGDTRGGRRTKWRHPKPKKKFVPGTET